MDGHEQLSLTTEWCDLTADEKVERGLRLANLLREADLLEDQHAEQKKDMKAEREALQTAIAELATVVRTGREERPIGHRRRQLEAGAPEVIDVDGRAEAEPGS